MDILLRSRLQYAMNINNLQGRMSQQIDIHRYSIPTDPTSFSLQIAYATLSSAARP